MPVTATTSTESQRPVGDQWPLIVEVTDADGFPAAEVPVITVTLPNGKTATPAVEQVGACQRAAYTLAAAGRYVAVAATTAYGVATFAVEAVPVTTAGMLPTAADITQYLGPNSWAATDIEDALAAETAAQRAICAIPAYYPADLAHALKRRVARNLGMRRVPLAQPVGDAEAGSTTIPPYDPEINRLERPHRRLLVA